MTNKADTEQLQEQMDVMKELFEWEELSKGFTEVVQSGNIEYIKKYFDSEIRKKYQDDYSKTNLTASIGRWVEKEATGIFTVDDVYKCLNVPRDQRGYISKVLSRIAYVRPTKRRPGEYRMIDKEMLEIEWWKTPVKPLEILWPLEIEKLYRPVPGEIALITGTKDAGKTAWCLRTTLLNMHKHKIDYYSSREGNQEFATRIALAELSEEDTATLRKNVTFYERNDSFADAIEINKSKFSIIDYITASMTEAYMIKDYIEKEIHPVVQALGAYCVIAVHKKPNSKESFGGVYIYNIPRLIVALERGVATLLSVKNRKTDYDLSGYMQTYKLVNGCQFIGDGAWRSEDAEETYQDSKKGRMG